MGGHAVAHNCRHCGWCRAGALFIGPFERDGWKVAAALTPITFIAWSLWLGHGHVAVTLERTFVPRQ